MSDEWNWGQDPKKQDDVPQQPEDADVTSDAANDQPTAPEESSENVTYHYKYARGSKVESTGYQKTDEGRDTSSGSDSEEDGRRYDSDREGSDGSREQPQYAHYQVEEEKKTSDSREKKHPVFHGKKVSSYLINTLKRIQ